MKQRPGNVSDAYLPDYDSDVFSGADRLQERIASKTQKVLVMGGSTVDCNCLPIFPEETAAAYIPVGDEGFVDPLLIHRVQYDHFPREHTRISLDEYRTVRKYIESFYRLGIEKGCQRVFWAHAPMSLLNENGFALKRRPVLMAFFGLYFPFSTNGKTYTSRGPVVDFGKHPGKVGDVPIYLPKTFFPGGSGMLLSSDKKEEVQKYLLRNVAKVFKNPF